MSPTHALTLKATYSSPPSIENEEPWVQHCIQAPWAWGASAVLKGALGSKSDQPYLDLVREPSLGYHWVSRKRVTEAPDGSTGTAISKRCDKWDGSYVAIIFSSKADLIAGSPAADSAGPMVQIDVTNGVRLAGQPIKGSWPSHNHFVWRDIDADPTDARWSSGDIVFDPNTISGEAIVFDAHKAELRWRVTRTRRVGGPGTMKIFSLKRAIQAPEGSLRLWPFPPNNREDFTRPLPPYKIHGPRRMVKSWDRLVRPNPLSRARNAIKRENCFAAACLRFALLNDVEVISPEDYAKLRKIHRQAPTVTLHQADFFPCAQGTMWLQHADGLIWEVFDSDGPILPGRASPEGFRKDNKDHTPWQNQAFFDQMERGWPTPGVYPEDHSVVIRPYTAALYCDIKRWVKDVAKGADPEALIRLFTWTVSNDLISIPWISALRSSIPKPGRFNEFRQIVNLSAAIKAWHANHAPPKIPNVPHFSDSLNERICSALDDKRDQHKLEMTKGADVGHGLAIFHDWDIPVEMMTFDAKSFFRASLRPFSRQY